jgi:hypothetical protein
MQSAERGGFSTRSDDRNDGEGSIVSELVSPIEHVRASIKLIESAIAMEPALSDSGTSANWNERVCRIRASVGSFGRPGVKRVG